MLYFSKKEFDGKWIDVSYSSIAHIVAHSTHICIPTVSRVAIPIYHRSAPPENFTIRENKNSQLRCHPDIYHRPSWTFCKFEQFQDFLLENKKFKEAESPAWYCFTKIIGIKPDIYRFQIYWFYPLAEARARVTENALQWEKTRHYLPEFNLTKECQKVAKRHWPWYW